MDYIITCLLFIFLFYLFISIIVTIDLVKAKESNKHLNYLHIIMVWLIPFFGAYSIRRNIIKKRKQEGLMKDISNNKKIKKNDESSDPLIDILPDPSSSHHFLDDLDIFD
jgi:hypothetical protein